MTRRFRVLVVSPGLPLPSWGAGTRIYHLVRHLATRHDISVVTFARLAEVESVATLHQAWPYVDDIEIIPTPTPRGRRRHQLAALASPRPFLSRELLSSQMQAAIDTRLRAEPFDIIHVEMTQMAGFRYTSPARLVLNEHNIEYELRGRMGESEGSRLRRLYHRFEQGKLTRFERQCWRRFDGVAVTSERERVIVERHAGSTPTVVVANAVDSDHFSPLPVEASPDTILFNGLLTYPPNLHAARALVDDLLPRIRRHRPSATLTIVGSADETTLDSLRGPGVTVTGWVADLRPYLAQASVVVAPLRVGSGTRLKVLEALSMARPLVATNVAVEGLGLSHGREVLIADDADRFADAVTALLSDPSAGCRLGRSGRARVVNDYSWQDAAARMEDLYATVVHRRGEEQPMAAGSATASRFHE